MRTVGLAHGESVDRLVESDLCASILLASVRSKLAGARVVLCQSRYNHKRYIGFL